MKFYIAKTHIFLALMVGLSSMAWANPAATLTGFAKLDVETYAAGPISGRAAKTANGIVVPFKAQPVQGFSGALKTMIAAILCWQIMVMAPRIIQQIFIADLSS